MAEDGTWPSISEHGLKSTVALLDFLEVPPNERDAIERNIRRNSVRINGAVGTAVIRDQKPLFRSALVKCLVGMTPEEWCWELNRRVFFWPAEERVLRLLMAKAYRDRHHCVLTVNTRNLLEKMWNAVHISPINSGSTLYRAQPRGAFTFRHISTYRAHETSHPKLTVAEVAVDYSVPTLHSMVIRVERRRADEAPEVIFEHRNHR